MGIQTSKRTNQRNTVLLLISMPIVLGAVMFLAFWILSLQEGYSATIGIETALQTTLYYISFLFPIILVWWTIAYFFHRQMIFSRSGALPLTRKENPEVYNIVENLAISRGLPVPKIGIIHDDSMNAFAIGLTPKTGWIVFSSGLLEKLTKQEIEAVAAHELTHIINRDSMLMIVIAIFVGIIATLGQIIIRVRTKKEGGQLIIIGFLFLLLGYVFYPIIQLAISRKREYLADAGAVELTKDKYAMISALQKISQDSQIESIQKESIAAMCIESPTGHKDSKSFFENMWATHPSIESRIQALENY